MAAIAYGADGLCIEAHIDPTKGIGDDPKQAVKPEVIKEIIDASAPYGASDISLNKENQLSMDVEFSIPY